jgi:hypothetical protein
MSEKMYSNLLKVKTGRQVARIIKMILILMMVPMATILAKTPDVAEYDYSSYLNDTLADNISDQKSINSMTATLSGVEVQPVSHWELDEGSGSTAYDSVGGNDGTITGATWTTGKYGNALSFDGNGDYVDCGNDESLNLTDIFTVSAWFKDDNPSVQNRNRGIVTKLQQEWSGSRYRGYSLVIGWGYPSMMLGAGSDTYTHTRADSVCQDTNWHHLVGVYNGTKCVLYFDGIKQMDEDTITVASNFHDLFIGKYYTDGSTLLFEGKIDEVMVFDQALSGQQIQQLYEQGYVGGGQQPVVDTLSCLYSTINNTIAPVFRGYVVDDGGEACQYRFRYKKSGESYNYTNWYGSLTTGRMFGVIVFSLSDGTYQYNAQARNSLGEGAWGDEETCVLPPPPSVSSLSEALDTTLEFDTGGNADWFYQTTTSYKDGDAAKSGAISHNQESWMQTMVTGPGTLSFYWMVSSEINYDYLEFYIDGVRQDRISGTVNWQQKTYTVSGEGSHTLLWRYIKDVSVSFGNDSGWADWVQWNPSSPPPPSNSLSDALDTTLDFTTGGNADWIYQTTTSYNDGDAAKSGAISHNQESWMQTMVSGDGTLSFYWMVSSEINYDYLEFYIDGVRQNRISGTVNWQQKTYTISGAGSHTLLWRYIKDPAVSFGNDSGWVDWVQWNPSSPPPPSKSLADALDTTLVIDTGGDADWIYQTTTSYNDGDAAKSGTISHNQESWMQTTVSGPGTLSFYWMASSEINYDFLEFYIDNVKQERISGTVSWQQKTYTISGAGSHTFLWRYIKDVSISFGNDSGWVDWVQWTPSSPPPPPSKSLADALDTTLVIDTGGDADWIYQTTTSYNDGDAAKSGTISHNQESWVQTTVSGPGTLSFYWMVSSEINYDFLEFYIDNVKQERISGTVSWQQKTYTISGAGSHTFLWRYVKDVSISFGNDSGWVDWVQWNPSSPPPPSNSLSDALDTTLVIDTGGNAEWIYQTTASYNDGDAAKSGTISHNQESWMQTTVSGPGTLSFYWMVSSEINYDFLEFYIDNVRQNRISGTISWQQKMYTITGAGMHTLLWRYVKDPGVSFGNDSGWVDWVQWNPSSPPPPSNSLSDALDTTLVIDTGGNTDWIYQTTASYNDGDAAKSGTISHSQESWMQTTVSGPGTLSFYWMVNSEVNYDFLEFYIDGVRQDRISGAVNWQKKSYTITGAGSHTLLWRYVKDVSVSFGNDSGWVDWVQFTP